MLSLSSSDTCEKGQWIPKVTESGQGRAGAHWSFLQHNGTRTRWNKEGPRPNWPQRPKSQTSLCSQAPHSRPLRCLPALCPPPAILSLHLAHPSRPTCQMPPPPWSNSWSLHVDLGLLNHYLKYLLLYIHLPSTTKWWVLEDTRHGSEPQPRAHAASHK